MRASERHQHPEAESEEAPYRLGARGSGLRRSTFLLWSCGFRVLIAGLGLLVLCLPLCAQTKQSGSKAVDYESELPPDARHLKLGGAAPDFSLRGVDGKVYSLADFKAAPVLMVIFLSDHCPASHAAETRLLPLYAELKTRGLAVVAISPNDPQAMAIGELGYTKYGDGYEEMQRYAREQGFEFPYLYDGDTQKTAKTYGCLCTPHVFIFDRERKLRYMGRFDDSRFAETNTVHSTDARNAIEALLAGRAVPVEVTRPFGCSTKWTENRAELIRINEKMYGAPVVLETINATDVAALARNGTPKLRLINVWATWCAPCVKEFPSIVALSHRFANRDFEVVTLSVDDPKDEARVKRFLADQHASVPNRVQRSLKAEGRRTNHYLFTGASVDALMQALDPAAPGPVPYTVLVAPGGKILYRQSGALAAAELQAKVVEYLGPYYTAPKE
jgi:peroxiredoxin